eukprot:GGOE01036233.1.p1 GENE.GGOE01036233.1~~GGOE01036233.1.p1  ORF type:complete len:384 (+),score=140.26 GGOE01036233.1:57-1208(+)
MAAGWLEEGKALVGKKAPPQDMRRKKQEVSVVTFCHGLADPDDPAERDRALNALPAFLARMKSYSEETCRALWRGIWTCHWHSDKPLVQLDCANRISKLIQSVPRTRDEATGILKPIIWSASFWMQSADEWPKLDFYRIDKFLSLFRLMLYETFCILTEETTSVLDINLFNRSIYEVFRSNTAGIAYHLCDCWLPEAQHAQLSPELLTRTLIIFVRWMAQHEAKNPALIHRIWKSVFNERLFQNPGLFNEEMLSELMRAELQASRANPRGFRSRGWYVQLEKKMKRSLRKAKGQVAVQKAKTKVQVKGDKDDFGYCQKYKLTRVKQRRVKIDRKQTQHAKKALESQLKQEARMKLHPKQFKNREKVKFSDFKEMPEDDERDYD